MIKFLMLLAFLTIGASSFASPESGQSDKAIYDALDTEELPVPTRYPYAEWLKNVGRLSCSHSINTQTQAEAYVCTLSNKPSN